MREMAAKMKEFDVELRLSHAESSNTSLELSHDIIQFEAQPWTAWNLKTPHGTASNLKTDDDRVNFGIDSPSTSC